MTFIAKSDNICHPELVRNCKKHVSIYASIYVWKCGYLMIWICEYVYTKCVCITLNVDGKYRCLLHVMIFTATTYFSSKNITSTPKKSTEASTEASTEHLLYILNDKWYTRAYTHCKTMTFIAESGTPRHPKLVRNCKNMFQFMCQFMCQNVGTLWYEFVNMFAPNVYV